MITIGRPIRIALLVTSVVAVAAIGLWAGRVARGPVRSVPSLPPTPGFAPGDVFPAVSVLDENGAALSTGSLVEGRGAVVLFLDLECSPCTTMVSRWKELLAGDPLRGVRLFGVTHFRPAAVREYRAARDVTFPIYSDTASTFIRVHGVNDFPLCVVVDRAGVVRWVTFDPAAEVPGRSIRDWLAPQPGGPRGSP